MIHLTLLKFECKNELSLKKNLRSLENLSYITVTISMFSENTDKNQNNFSLLEKKKAI